jgi:hypothetical protein
LRVWIALRSRFLVPAQSLGIVLGYPVSIKATIAKPALAFGVSSASKTYKRFKFGFSALI